MCKLRHSRLSLEEAATILSRENKRVSDDPDVMHLRVSQAKAVQQFDHRFAVQLKDNATDEPAEQSENALDNDGTNACAFLSVKIADVILSEVVTGIEFFVELAEAIHAMHNENLLEKAGNKFTRKRGRSGHCVFLRILLPGK